MNTVSYRYATISFHNAISLVTVTDSVVANSFHVAFDSIVSVAQDLGPYVFISYHASGVPKRLHLVHFSIANCSFGCPTEFPQRMTIPVPLPVAQGSGNSSVTRLRSYPSTVGQWTARASRVFSHLTIVVFFKACNRILIYIGKEVYAKL